MFEREGGRDERERGMEGGNEGSREGVYRGREGGREGGTSSYYFIILALAYTDNG